MASWEEILRGQALTCGEIAERCGKSRPTMLKLLQDAVSRGDLEIREQDSSLFYAVKEKSKDVL